MVAFHFAVDARHLKLRHIDFNAALSHVRQTRVPFVKIEEEKEKEKEKESQPVATEEINSFQLCRSFFRGSRLKNIRNEVHFVPKETARRGL